MHILVEIGHPAHVHFFKKTLDRLRTQGHKISIVSRNKDITNALLTRLNLPFISLSTPPKKRIFLGLELLSRWLKITFLMLIRRIDIAISISGISTSVPAWILRRPNLLFTDTEDATLTNKVSFPYATKIYTPDFFLKSLGPKHVRYSSLHELAYLRDFSLEMAEQKRLAHRMPKHYSIIRLVANKALHDIGVKGGTDDEVRELISLLQPHGNVFLSSERDLPEDLKPYELRTPIEDIHSILAGAHLFVGESPTMAVESSLLGVPAILINTRSPFLGNMVGLEKLGLLINVDHWNKAKEKIRSTDWTTEKKLWQSRSENFRRQSPVLEDFIEAELIKYGSQLTPGAVYLEISNDSRHL